jgi:hypothetical protein
MKKYLVTCKRIFTLCAFIFCTAAYSQKDTLHIYYVGLKTEVADSNDAKIANWAKTLKGKHVDVEIYTYYDNGDFRKFMAERADNLNLIVLRKARDMITIKHTGPLRGKKSQRSTADIVYTSLKAPQPVTPAASSGEAEKKVNDRKKQADPDEKGESAKSGNAGEKEAKAEDKKSEKKEQKSGDAEEKVAESKGEKSDKSGAKPKEKKKAIVLDTDKYIYDTVYVNGVMKINKRKKK